MSNLTNRVKQLSKKSLNLIHRLPGGRDLLNWVITEHLLLLSDSSERIRWTSIEPIYTRCRRQLQHTPSWRLGPTRVHDVAQEAFDALSAQTSIVGKTYCDLGCGGHPYGVSTVMFLNGADAAIAIDINPCDGQRAAEATADLLVECMIDEPRWHWSDISAEEYFQRIRRFDLKALKDGQLEKGVADVPLQYVITDIHNPTIEAESIDIMSSRSVLECLQNFDVAIHKLFALMRKGGVAYHHIDLSDLRSHANSRRYHPWSFLAEDDPQSERWRGFNGLRSCEIKHIFERIGFDILHYETRQDKMPEGFYQKVTGRFRDLSEEELSITGVFCVLRKP